MALTQMRMSLGTPATRATPVPKATLITVLMKWKRPVLTNQSRVTL